MDKINRLLISDQNKNDLRIGKPFWGAPPHMVELAFGGPADDAVIQQKDNRLFEFHYFGFGGNREPIVVEYQDSALSCVHYPQNHERNKHRAATEKKEAESQCNPGNQSFYAKDGFPFNYKVIIGQ